MNRQSTRRRSCPHGRPKNTIEELAGREDTAVVEIFARVVDKYDNRADYPIGFLVLSEPHAQRAWCAYKVAATGSSRQDSVEAVTDWIQRAATLFAEDIGASFGLRVSCEARIDSERRPIHPEPEPSDALVQDVAAAAAAEASADGLAHFQLLYTLSAPLSEILPEAPAIRQRNADANIVREPSFAAYFARAIETGDGPALDAINRWMRSNAQPKRKPEDWATILHRLALTETAVSARIKQLRAVRRAQARPLSKSQVRDEFANDPVLSGLLDKTYLWDRAAAFANQRSGGETELARRLVAYAHNVTPLSIKKEANRARLRDRNRTNRS